MRIASLLSAGTLALVLAAPLASVANAGDHAGGQWRVDNDNGRVQTSYVQADPALIQMEAKAYQRDLGRQQQAQMPTSGTAATGIAK